VCVCSPAHVSGSVKISKVMLESQACVNLNEEILS